MGDLWEEKRCQKENRALAQLYACAGVCVCICVCVCVCVFVHILQLHSSCHLLSIMDEGLVAAIIAIVQNESVTAQDGGYTLHPTALCRQITKFCLALSPPTHKPENCVCVCACACACVCVCVRCTGLWGEEANH